MSDFSIAIYRPDSPELQPDSDFCRRWRALARTEDYPDLFCLTPEWQLPFHRVFTKELPIIVIEGEDSILVMACQKTPRGQMVFHPIECGWFYARPLMGPNALDLLEMAIPTLRHLTTLPCALLMSGLEPGRGMARQLLRRFCSTVRFFRRKGSVLGGASLEGGMDAWFSRRSANHRSKLRKAMKRGRIRGITFERRMPVTVEEAGAIYDRMQAIELTSWKGQNRCGMEEQGSKEFYRIMIERLAVLGTCRVIFARCDDRDIGFIFGGLCGTSYRGQQFSFNNEFKVWSVGNLMQEQQLEWLCEEGILRYDMGAITGERMGYKKHWTECWSPIEAWHIVP